MSENPSTEDVIISLVSVGSLGDSYYNFIIFTKLAWPGDSERTYVFELS